MRGPSLVVASGGHSSSRCAGLSLSWPPLLRSTGSRRTGSVVVAHGPSRSAACGILPDQGPNPSPLHWQADSQPLRHQGSPCYSFYIKILHIFLYIYYSCLIVFAGILNTFCWYSKQLVILNNFFTALLNKVTLFFFFFCWSTKVPFYFQYWFCIQQACCLTHLRVLIVYVYILLDFLFRKLDFDDNSFIISLTIHINFIAFPWIVSLGHLYNVE